MAEENTQAVEETEIEEGEIVELEPVEEEQGTEAPVESEDAEAEAVIEDESNTEETKKKDQHEDYSEKVQKRIGTLTRKLREAERGRDSAYEYAKSTAQENQMLKQKTSTLDRSFLTEAESRLKAQKTQAMTALKHANENQDYEKAAALRDDEKHCQAELEETLKNWKANTEETTVEVSEEEIMAVISKWTGVPLSSQGANSSVWRLHARWSKSPPLSLRTSLRPTWTLRPVRLFWT